LSGEFKIAVVLPLTGQFGPVGTDIQTGYQAGAADVNKHGGILGREVKLVIRDSASNAQQAVSAMRDLLADPTINAAVPEVFAGPNAAVLPLLEERKLISVSNGSFPDAGDPTKHPFNFQFTVTAAQQTAAALQIVTETGKKKLGVIGFTDANGQANAKLFADTAPSKGLQVVGTELFDATAKDYTPQLQKLRDAGAEVIVGQASGAPIGVIAQGLADLGWDVPVVGNPSWAASPLNDLVPAPAKPQIHFAQVLAGGRTGDSLSAQQAAFVQEIQDSGGKVGSLSVNSAGADAITGLAYAFNKAGSLDEAAAVKAMEGMAADPTAPTLNWQFFAGQSPKFTAQAHNPSGIDVSKAFLNCAIGPTVSGTYPCKAL
jgi:branched-chain amino acid transport system substrate-binding protein